MGTSLITAPTAEPITLGEARAQCRVTHELDDAAFAALILSAREWAQGFTRRTFMTQTWEYTLQGFPSEIELPFFPVQSITSVKYVDTVGATQTLSGSAYESDLVSVVSRIRAAAGYAWPSTKYVYNAVTVRLVAGYADNHPDLLTVRAAMLMHVEAHYDREATNFDNLMKAAESLLGQLRIIRL